MTMIDSLAISVPTILTLIGVIVAIENYKLKKKDSDKKDTAEEVQKKKEEDERQKQNELQLVGIAKDVQYIRITVDKIEHREEDHEKRIQLLEKTCRKMKGAK